jgi:DNA repair exonuclease SbcCD nuclease subunit
MSKILAIGDPHFKVDNTDESTMFIDNLKRWIDEHLHELCKIIVLGDILHTHEKIHTVALNNAVEFFKMLTSFGIPVYALVGNHDATSNTIFLTNNHWLNTLKGWDNLTIVDYPIKISYNYSNTSDIVLCPYVPDGRFVEALNHVNSWKDALIVFGHQLINGAKMGMIVATDVEEWKEEYPYLISGHIHDKQQIRVNAYYTGSSMQHSFGESGDKSLCLISVSDRNVTFEEVYLTIRKKKILYADVTNLEETLEKMKEEVEYKIVLSGEESDFKALKNSSLYKEAMKCDNLKNITFKSKINKELTKDIEHKNDDFCQCLQELVKSEDDPYLTSLYEHIMYGKEDLSDKDVFFFQNEEN